MEFSLIAADTVAACKGKQGIAFGQPLLNQWDFANHISLAVDQSPGGFIQASANKTIRRIRKKRRTKRAYLGEDGGDFGRFLVESDFGGNDDGPFGFGGGGCGKGGNYGGGSGGFGGGNWDESSSWSWSDPAMEFVYEVICWIALSNCLHFAFKRIVRIVTDGEKEKLNLTLSPVC